VHRSPSFDHNLSASNPARCFWSATFRINAIEFAITEFIDFTDCRPCRWPKLKRILRTEAKVGNVFPDPGERYIISTALVLKPLQLTSRVSARQTMLGSKLGVTGFSINAGCELSKRLSNRLSPILNATLANVGNADIHAPVIVSISAAH
jgi:hypothetical protein